MFEKSSLSPSSSPPLSLSFLENSVSLHYSVRVVDGGGDVQANIEHDLGRGDVQANIEHELGRGDVEADTRLSRAIEVAVVVGQRGLKLEGVL